MGDSSPPRRAALNSAQGIVRVGLCVDFVRLRVARHHRPRSLALQLFRPCPGTDEAVARFPRDASPDALHQQLYAATKGTLCHQQMLIVWCLHRMPTPAESGRTGDVCAAIHAIQLHKNLLRLRPDPPRYGSSTYADSRQIVQGGWARTPRSAPVASYADHRQSGHIGASWILWILCVFREMVRNARPAAKRSGQRHETATS